LEGLPIILVVEDDPFVRGVVEETLTDGGFEIAMLSSVENVIDLLEVLKVNYRDVVPNINL
jgi:CheY-like chemotaxis protein